MSRLEWRPSELSRRNRLVLYYFLGLAALVAAFTLVYNYSMATLEGERQSIFASFEFVVQTMTTTGYGQDSGVWSHPLMFTFVAFVQISGIALGFFTLRLIIIPLFTGAEVSLENRLSPKHDHVIVCGYRRDSAVLLEEFDELDIDYVLISEDEEEARDLSDDGYSVVHGDPGEEDTYRRATIDRASAVITDAGEGNVEAILTVRSLRPEVELITLTDDSDIADVLEAAGADTVLSPHGVLGHRLAEKAVSSIGRELRDTISLGEAVEVTEISVHNDSPLDGVRIRDSNVRERTGAIIVGAWIDGELQLPPAPDAIMSPNTVLVVAGEHEALEQLSEFTRPAGETEPVSQAIVAGFGEVGRSAEAVFDGEGIETTTIDRADTDGVEIVGDAGSRDVLRDAGVVDAEIVLVGVPNDATGLLATTLARSLNDDAQILLRVSDPDATRKGLRAGADYVLSVPRVSARMIARELRGEEVLGPASQIRLVRVSAAPFAGETLADSGIYERTGCRVVAIESGDGISTTPDPDYEFDDADRIDIVGTDETIQSFFKRFDVSRV